MPESKKRKKVEQRRIAAQQHAQVKRSETHVTQSPKWWVPVMATLAVIGLLFIVTAYVTGGSYPIPGFSNGNYNLFIGIGFVLAGFLMIMGWK